MSSCADLSPDLEVVVLLLNDPPPGETSDWVEAGRRRRPPSSDGSPGLPARWLRRCDGLRAPSPPPPLASVGHLTLRRPPHPPEPARRSRPPPSSADCRFLRSPAVTVVAVTGCRVCVRRRRPTSSCRPPPRPPPLSPIPSPPMTHSFPAPRGMFFRPEETPADRTSIVPDCLPLRETSRLLLRRGLRRAPPLPPPRHLPHLPSSHSLAPPLLPVVSYYWVAIFG